MTTAITIKATDPPFGPGAGVLFGLQNKREVEDPVPAEGTTEFHTGIEIRSTAEGTDFAGRHVNGRKGDRFIYLSWGLPDPTGEFVMVARAKIKLNAIPDELLQQAINDGAGLRADLAATNAKGQPASGTIKPDAIRWSVHP